MYRVFAHIFFLFSLSHIKLSFNITLLTDKLYCGLCGAKMTREVEKHKYHYYKCVNSKGGLKTCQKKVDREFVEELVLKKLGKC